MADASRGELLDDGGAETTAANDRDARRGKALLAGDTDLGQDELAGMTTKHQRGRPCR